MFTKTIACVAFFSSIAVPAFAHGYQQQPQQHALLSAVVAAGNNHNSLANVSANVGSRDSLANVNANLLGGTVKANVAVDQTSRHSDTLLGINLNLDGGVGNHH